MQFPTNAAPGGNAPVDKSDLIKDGSDRTFMADVIEASREVPVIVDFWAPWCGPCKTLGPIIEKAVLAAKGAVKLVKIDTDQNPAIAGQLRIQSIPAVYAFFQGRPVDGFTGALPESQVKQFIDRLVQAAGGVPGAADIAAVLEEAGQLLESGDAQTAAALYNEVLGEEPEKCRGLRWPDPLPAGRRPGGHRAGDAGPGTGGPGQGAGDRGPAHADGPGPPGGGHGPRGRPGTGGGGRCRQPPGAL
ncbi:thioredoxin [Nitrospirillum viridazoti Y2]|nr:thioredoxin [Nitrospirillum amazonense Y2]